MKYRSFPDIVGQKFNKITVLGKKLPSPKVLIRCECGVEKAVSKYDVFSGRVKSCGSKKCVNRSQDLTGRKYGLLTVLGIANEMLSKGIKSRCTQWTCQCQCLQFLVVPSNQLTSGRTKSCGCSKGIWISEKNSLPIKERVENELFSVYKENAKKREYGFSLSKSEFISFLYSTCYYCGVAPSNFMKKVKITGTEIHYFNGIDRVNNDKGYDADNCVSCCKLCNHAKNNLSKEEFISLAKKIASRF